MQVASNMAEWCSACMPITDIYENPCFCCCLYYQSEFIRIFSMFVSCFLDRVSVLRSHLGSVLLAG